MGLRDGLNEWVEKLRKKALGEGDPYGGEEYDDMFDTPEEKTIRREGPRGDRPRLEPLPPKTGRASAPPSGPRVVQMPGTAPRQSEIIVAAPDSINDCEEICGYIREGCAVALNLEGVSKEDGQRVLDFLTGAACALDGKIEECTPRVFILAPRHYMITGQHREVLTKAGIVLPLAKF